MSRFSTHRQSKCQWYRHTRCLHVGCVRTDRTYSKKDVTIKISHKKIYNFMYVIFTYISVPVQVRRMDTDSQSVLNQYIGPPRRNNGDTRTNMNRIDPRPDGSCSQQRARKVSVCTKYVQRTTFPGFFPIHVHALWWCSSKV